MSWRVVFDYGTHKDYWPVRSSEWAANLIASEYRFKAKLAGSKVKIYVEEVKA